IIGEKAYAMPALSRLPDHRSFYGHSECQRRDEFHRVALSELWRYHRPSHCAPSPGGTECSCEIEAALVGSHSHAFRFVKKQKGGHVESSDDPVPSLVKKPASQSPYARHRLRLSQRFQESL